MALLRKLSIKWKLSLALIFSGLTLVTTYVWIAKRVFESDKISYVFDSQGSRLISMRSEIEGKFERALLAGRSVVATFDFNLGKPSSAGEQIFQEEKAILGLELYSVKQDKSLFRLEKNPSALPPSTAADRSIPVGKLDMQTLDGGRFLCRLAYEQPSQGVFVLRVVLQMDDLLPKPNATQSIALAQGTKIISVSDLRGIDSAVFAGIAQEIDPSSSDRTRMWKHGKDRYLVSEAGLRMSNLRLLSLIPESEALGALATLFNRSIVFLLFSVFGLVAVSLTMARSLTMNLLTLTQSAEEIGSGKFDATPSIRSEDEMGVLAKAFTKMSQEIKRLLVETKEKARMEQELKTASLVQERLLPLQAANSFGEIEVHGLVITSSECGGDWWYYFVKGDEIYIAIADATGHGTPAALITAAARSIFSRLECEDLSLSEMMRAWDIAVSSCSQKQVFMTGLLIRINIKTGKGLVLNAAHEAPVFYRQQADGSFELEYVDLEVSTRIGDGLGSHLVEQEFSLGPNDVAILFTDGLFAVTSASGKTLSEKRFWKKLTERIEFNRSAKKVSQAALRAFNDHRESQPLPDDVSIVSIRRSGPNRSGELQNEEGQMGQGAQT